MKERTNCLNCGATLHYDETSYGSTAKCKYCRTEYHIDKLGRVEEYKVKIKMFDKIISFYIGTMRYEPVCAYDTSYITENGRMSTRIRNEMPTIELSLISYDMEDVVEGK